MSNTPHTLHVHRFRLALLPCFVLLLWTSTISGQLNEPPQIAALMDRWAESNREQVDVQGWRIQILATVDRRQMETVVRRFENLYPEYKLHTVHNEPYYLVKVGAFLTLQKAQAFIRKMQKEYPQAIPVNDIIKVEEMVNYDQ